MTPCINLLKKANVSFKVHEYQHDPSVDSYGLEAAEKLGVSAERVFKTLVVSLDGKELAVALVPVAERLNLKRLAKASGAKKVEMANKAQVERVTGYVLGGVSPLGQKKRLKTFIDQSAETVATMFVSAGRRGLEVELNPSDFKALTQGQWASLVLV
ncbi:Cys-tRNA(Pro) deacylase [Nitrincola alkalisediminis]|uniref:Cys-tRNA(Pro) deacylase n=1 Tax=Nitrincola alkalisediminis TaxID=1366656 RepID=UPI0018739B51|nr:Cys-tRNA(Pro) deacylase [Nitrincola alkalisediminis]